MLFATNTRRAAILTNLLFSLPVAVGLLSAAPTASAQTNLDVNVPFAFSANDQHLPAGSYRVTAIAALLVDSQRKDSEDHRSDDSSGTGTCFPRATAASSSTATETRTI